MAVRRPLVLVNGIPAELPSGDSTPGGAAEVVLSSFEANLGATARTSGSFLIQGLSGLTVGKPVLIQKATGPYTGKGSRADEAEMDLITTAGVVESSSTVRVYWQSAKLVRGNFKFNYLIGA
jgi:hypothetical protein